MRAYDLIDKKKHGEALTEDEIRFMVQGFVSGEIPDYQMASMLMAIYFQGMNEEEMTYLTLDMARSGDMVDLSAIEGIKVDKHSTGGVGDKTTLVIGPIVAALGVKVAKMSGRGLGHTGGTIDKMEAIPGLQTSIAKEQFFDIVNKIGIAVIGQSGNIVPADKKLYALRDVTATVDSIPLIASSIMSKKIAAGSDGIVLDVKTGSGAFMTTLDDSITLAKEMVSIGVGAGRRCCALITDMDVPLGYAIGNSLEVIEAVNTLNNQGPDDLTQVCLWLAAHMLHMADMGEVEHCYQMAKGVLEDGSGLKVLADMVEAQGGDPRYIIDTDCFEQSKYSYEVLAEQGGFISHIDTQACGIASVILGAGRSKKEDLIDYTAGILLKKKYGDSVQRGDVLAVLYSNDQALFDEAANKIINAYEIGSQIAEEKKLIYARVTNHEITRF